MKNLIKFILMISAVTAAVTAAAVVFKKRTGRPVLIEEYDGEAMFIG